MEMELKANKHISLNEVMAENEFTRNWDKSGSIWKDNKGKEWEFIGWGPSPDGMMPKNPEYVELISNDAKDHLHKSL